MVQSRNLKSRHDWKLVDWDVELQFNSNKRSKKNPSFKTSFCNQTVKTLIRRRVLCCLIWVCIVCTCPIIRTIGSPWLNWGIFNSESLRALFHHSMLIGLVVSRDDTLHTLGSLHASQTHFLFSQKQYLNLSSEYLFLLSVPRRWFCRCWSIVYCCSHCLCGFCVRSLFCYAVLCVLSSFAIILLR